MPVELPASALYSHPKLGRLWKQVHLACSPFRHRPAITRLYQQPAVLVRKKLTRPYSFIALGCADGAKELLLLKKMPPPACLWAGDINLSLARRAASRLPACQKRSFKIDLVEPLPAFHLPPSTPRATRHPLLVTLFGVLPNLDPLPLLERVARVMRKGDLLLFSANLAPGRLGIRGARQILPQYDNPPTRRWLEAAVHHYRPRLPQGRLEFGVFPDPRQTSLARIEARWVSPRQTWIVFASRRPTVAQVETWIRQAHLKKVARFVDPLGEEGLWLVEPIPS